MTSITLGAVGGDKTALFMRTLILFSLFVITMLESGSSALAQSTNRSSPTALQVNQIVGAQHGEGGDFYYSFNAGPGEVTLTADGKTNYYATNLEVICTDVRGNRLARVNLSADNTLRASATKFYLTSAQPVMMQLHFFKDDAIKNFLYRVTLSGAVQMKIVTDNDATYAHVENSVNNYYAQNPAQRPDRRAVRGNRGYYTAPETSVNDQRRQEFNARYQAAEAERQEHNRQVAEARRESEAQRIARNRMIATQRNITDPRRFIQQQILGNRNSNRYSRNYQQGSRAVSSYETQDEPIQQMQQAPPVVPTYQQPVYQQPQLQPQIQQVAVSVPQVQPQPQTSAQQAVQSPIQSINPTREKTSVITEDTTADAVLDAPITDKWALVIGVSKFADSSINLKYPSKDAKDFRDFLVNEAHFQPDHIRLLLDENATKAKVIDLLGDNWLPRRAFEKDLVVIFISTHGSPSSADRIGGINFLLMHDSDPQRLYATGLAVHDIARMLKDRVNAKRTLLILDACHSGSAEAKGLARVNNIDLNNFPVGEGHMVICSSKPDQVSWESKRYDNGVFTAQLLKSLREKGNSGSMSDAFKAMQDKVENEVLKDRGQMQTPVLKTKWRGKELILSAPPANPHSDSEK